MAFKKTDLHKLATLLKMKPEDVEKVATEKDEVDLVIPEGLTVLSTDEVTTLKNNEYANGKKTGVEMAVKETRDKLGLTFTGKTMDGLVEAVQKKATDDAGAKPDEKVKQLELELTNLRKTAGEYETKVKTVQDQYDVLQLNHDLYAHIPMGTTMPGRKIIGLMQMDGIVFKKEEGQVFAYKDGVKVIDKLSAPVAAKDVIAGYITEQKLMGAGGGAAEGAGGQGGAGGAGGAGGGKLTKLSQLTAKYEGEKKSTMGKEFMDEAAALKKADPEFDFNS